MSAGHFVPVISRWGHNATYFDERNVHVQCYHCNRMEEGRGWQMGMYIAQKYGEDMPGYLWTLAAEPWKFTGPWFNERINYYRAEVKKLKNQKDLSE